MIIACYSFSRWIQFSFILWHVQLNNSSNSGRYATLPFIFRLLIVNSICPNCLPDTFLIAAELPLCLLTTLRLGTAFTIEFCRVTIWMCHLIQLLLISVTSLTGWLVFLLTFVLLIKAGMVFPSCDDAFSVLFIFLLILLGCERSSHSGHPTTGASSNPGYHSSYKRWERIQVRRFLGLWTPKHGNLPSSDSINRWHNSLESATSTSWYHDLIECPSGTRRPTGCKSSCLSGTGALIYLFSNVLLFSCFLSHFLCFWSKVRNGRIRHIASFFWIWFSFFVIVFEVSASNPSDSFWRLSADIAAFRKLFYYRYLRFQTSFRYYDFLPGLLVRIKFLSSCV